MQLIKYYSVNNPCYKNNVNKADSRYTTFQSRGPQGLMLHSVGCAQPSAKVFADRWNRSGIEVAVHAVLQADGTVYQCLPWNYRGWHAGSTANNTHVGVEMTEPSQIKYTGGSAFTITDKAAAQEQAKGTYQTAVELFAQLCKEYSLDPLGNGVIISHHEGYLRGVASDHGDPEHLWKGLGLSYTMDGFRKDVKAAMSEEATAKKYTIGWHKDSKGWWYADTETTYYADKWAKIKEKWYYFDKEGYMVSNAWKVEADSDTYYLGADGDMQTNMVVGLGSDGRLQPIEPWYHLISELPDYYRTEIDKLVADGKLAGKSGEGENLVLDLSESALRAIIICNR
jgi:glucan-binding YG repeat protein